MANAIWMDQDTLAGVDKTVDILSSGRFAAEAVLLSNDDGSNTYTLTVNGFSTTILPGEVVRLSGTVKRFVLNGTGDFRVWASENPGSLPDLSKPAGLSAQSVGTAEIVDLAVTTGKINNLAVTAGKLATDAVETLKIKDLNVTTGKLAVGVISADAAGRALFAAGVLDLATFGSAVAAKAVEATKLEDGGASAGIDGSDVRFGQEVAGAGTLAVSGTPELIFGVTVPDGGGDIDFTLGPQKIRITGAEFHYAGTGAAGDRYQLKTASGAADITDSINGSGTQGAIVRASSLQNRNVAGGASLRLSVTDAGGTDCSGVFYVRCVPVA